MSLPNELHPLQLAASSGGYEIEQSLRFNSADSAYLNRTPVSAGNRRTFTWSFWIKRAAALAANQRIFDVYDAGTGFTDTLYFGTGDAMSFWLADASQGVFTTSQVFRDCSAWYHIVLAIDTTQGTNTDRIKLYVNGSQVTEFSSITYPSLNYDCYINNTVAHNVGLAAPTANQYLNGYLTEVNFIDGSALDPTDFGEFDNNGVWRPKRYSGSYGTNGFYLPFSDDSSEQSLGWDASVSNVTYYATPGTYSYTVPAYTTSLVVEVWGGGGGGAQAPTGGTDATDGGQSSFNGTVIANGGSHGVAVNSGVGANGTGGTASGGDINTTGNNGNSTAAASSSTPSPASGNSAIAGVIGPGGFSGVTGFSVGSGGGGAYWTGGSVPTGGAGGSGGYSKITYGPGAITGTVSVVVGARGNGGIGLALNGGYGTAGMVRITVDQATTPNDWYGRGFSVTAGSSNDAMSDTPTTNWCTLNPLAVSNTTRSPSDGNLVMAFGGTYPTNVLGSFGVSSGKWYWEVDFAGGTSGNGHACGVAIGEWAKKNVDPYNQTTPNHYIDSRGNFYNSGTATANSTSFGPGDIIGIALDVDNDEVSFYKNGTIVGSAQSLETGQTWHSFHKNSSFTALTQTVNFGQRAFAYTPPTGYSALNTAALPAPDIADPSLWFDVKTHIGYTTGAWFTLGQNFDIDFIWTKNKTSAYNHVLVDSVRGNNNSLASNTTAIENTSAGVLLGTGANSKQVYFNGSVNEISNTGQTYVDWLWKAGGSGSSIAAGSIDGTNPTIASTVSANPTAGFSIVSYTADGASAQTIAHGLNDVPAMIITKVRNNAGGNFGVYHKSIGNTGALFLNVTNGIATNSLYWNNTTPTSSVFSVGSNNTDTNWLTYNFVAYCFAEVEGYNKFGSYTGNGNADGPFVHCGFKPRFLLIKGTNAGSNWEMIDTARDPDNVANQQIFANLTTPYPNYTFGDVVSNGFKIRDNSSGLQGNYNNNGQTYIFAAFAEHPFGGFGVSPATAR